MKKFTYTLVLMLITTTLTLAGNGDKTPIKDKEAPESTVSTRDKQVSLSAKCVNNVVYLKLRMLNESKSGFYSLVREFADGTFESVGVREIVANNINTPLLYSFMDNEVPDMDVNYVLYRITDESVEVKRWNYCATNQQLCEGAVLASNE